MQLSVHNDFALDTILSIQLADLMRGSLDIRKGLVEQSCTFDQCLTHPVLQSVLVSKVVDVFLLELTEGLAFEKRTVSKSLRLLGSLRLRFFNFSLVRHASPSDCITRQVHCFCNRGIVAVHS